MKRKSLKHRSKRAWIVAGVAAFAGVSLLSTGFAAWVVGVNQLSDQDSATVTVDTTTSASTIFEITSVGSAKIGETAAYTGGKVVNTDNNWSATNMQFTMTFTIEVGKSASTTPKSITFALATADSEDDTDTTNKANIVATSSSKFQYRTIEEGVTEFTYIAAPSSLTLSDLTSYASSVGSEDSSSTTVTTTYTNVPVSLNWGSFFGGVSPCNYYNAALGSNDATVADAEAVEEELTTMYSVLTDASIVLDVTLVVE